MYTALYRAFRPETFDENYSENFWQFVKKLTTIVKENMTVRYVYVNTKIGRAHV